MEQAKLVRDTLTRLTGVTFGLYADGVKSIHPGVDKWTVKPTGESPGIAHSTKLDGRERIALVYGPSDVLRVTLWSAFSVGQQRVGGVIDIPLTKLCDALKQDVEAFNKRIK